MVAKTVSKDQAQQDDRAFYHPSLQKSAGLPRASLKSCRAPKPVYDMVPVPIQERFVSHPTLNHKPLPNSKNILTPMRESGDPVQQIEEFEQLALGPRFRGDERLIQLIAFERNLL